MDRQTITVDIAPEGYADHRLKVSQYDVGRPLGVYIEQDGADLDCSGYTAQLYLYKPDRTNIEKSCAISNNLITWDTTEQETIVAGICVAEIRIREGNRNVGTANFTIWVEESPADTSGSSHSESQSLIEMVDRAEDAAETAESSAAIAVHAKDETVAAAEAVERFDQMTAEAETLAPGSEATAEMDYTGEHPVVKFGIPAGATGATGATGPQGAQGLPGSQGEPGNDGFSPTVTVTDITGGHRVTITDAEGDHTFDVMDGQGGSGGAVSSVNGETGDVVLDGTKVNVNNSASDPETVEDALGRVNRALNDLIIEKATANIFDSDFDESGYIDDANGDKASAGYVRTSKYYPVDDSNSKIYTYNPDSGNTTNLLYYDDQKTFISRVSISPESTNRDIPTGAAYFRVYRNNYKTQPITITYEYAGKTIPYKHWMELQDNIVGYDSVINEAKRKLGSVLHGRKILAFGDSVWGNDRTNGICDFLAEYSGATVYNGAIGGTKITDLRSSQYDSPQYVYFDGVKLVHALMTNTWTDQDANVDNVLSYVKTDTLPMLKSLDVSTIDVITIAYGHNDITSSETLEQIKTALGTIIDDILSHYPTIRILVIAPPWRMFSSGTVDGDNYESSTGITQRSLADGLIDKATSKHITSIDMLKELPWCANTAETYMDTDKVHPNTAGNALYAHVIYGKLKSMF